MPIVLLNTNSWPMISTTTHGLSGPGNNGFERLLHIFQISWNGVSSSGSVKYQDTTFVGGILSLSREYSWYTLTPADRTEMRLADEVIIATHKDIALPRYRRSLMLTCRLGSLKWVKQVKDVEVGKVLAYGIERVSGKSFWCSG